ACARSSSTPVTPIALQVPSGTPPLSKLSKKRHVIFAAVLTRLRFAPRVSLACLSPSRRSFAHLPALQEIAALPLAPSRNSRWPFAPQTHAQKPQQPHSKWRADASIWWAALKARG